MASEIQNIYAPIDVEIKEILSLAPDVSLYRMDGYSNGCKAGQFFMVSVFGAGEAPISVASSPDELLKLCIRRAGHVTSAIHNLREGDKLGIRGPYGNGFPLSGAKGRDVIVAAGGIGIVPLRPLMREILGNRHHYKKVFLIYGSKTPSEILFKDEINIWSESGIEVSLTVDCGDDTWKGCVGLVTTLIKSIKTDFKDASAFICGPEAMINASMNELSSKGMPDERIVTTLESHMKCGVGKCGHCYRGPKYVCTNGPVFSFKEIKELMSKI
jgi:NAD(P)H-flavin reductase